MKKKEQKKKNTRKMSLKKINLEKINKKKLILIATLFVIVLSLVTYIFVINREHRNFDIYTDVTFMSPRQALIFWKTDEDTLGYIKYGEKKLNRKNMELQTSSEPGEIHVVFLENIPLEGLYISIHNESDSFLIFPKVFKIQFNEEDLMYE